MQSQVADIVDSFGCITRIIYNNIIIHILQYRYIEIIEL